jgi:hypothetical protein
LKNPFRKQLVQPKAGGCFVARNEAIRGLGLLFGQAKSNNESMTTMLPMPN